jgi:hypothetical protein
MNFFIWLSFQGCEFLEDMEYDWDDYFDAYEGASVECDGTVVQVNDYFIETLGNKEQALLDEFT